MTTDQLFTKQFFDAATAAAERAIFIDDDREITGSQADSEARAIAHHLLETTSDQSVVAFFCPGSARHAVTWFGAISAGRIACNLHLRETPEKLATVLEWLAPETIVVDRDSADLATSALALASLETQPQILTLADDGNFITYSQFAADGEAGESSELPTPSAEDVAAILLSSGTTGEPKGIVHTHESFTAAAIGGQAPWQVTEPGKRLLLYLQPSFAAWAVMVLPSATSGTTVIFGSQFTPTGFLERCQNQRITHAPIVPTMSRMIVANGPENYDLSSLEFVSLGGEPPSGDDVEQLAAKVCDNIMVAYLASETMPASAVFGSGVELARRGKTGSTGQPGPTTEIRIVDPGGDISDELPAGEKGEIVVRGPSNSIGYWKAPELTAQKFVDGWWRSGDLGTIDEDGDVWVQGRADNVINTGGIKVSGEEVENALLAHPGVVNCAVVGQPDADFGRRIEAFIVPADDRPTVEELDRFLRSEQSLSGFKVPKVMTFVDELPLGPTGKLYRRALIKPETR